MVSIAATTMRQALHSDGKAVRAISAFDRSPRIEVSAGTAAALRPAFSPGLEDRPAAPVREPCVAPSVLGDGPDHSAEPADRAKCGGQAAPEPEHFAHETIAAFRQVGSLRIASSASPKCGREKRVVTMPSVRIRPLRK